MDDLSDITPVIPATMTQEAMDAALRVLALRRSIMERLCGCQDHEAQIALNEAAVGALTEQLAKGDLGTWQAASVRGRIKEANARINHSQQQIEQAHLEIAIYRAALKR